MSRHSTAVPSTSIPQPSRPARVRAEVRPVAGLDDLVAGKVYALVDDESAVASGLVRVVDESGEDYLYPSERFELLELSPDAASRVGRALTAA